MKNCIHCKKELKRKIYNSGEKEHPAHFLVRIFCDRLCYREEIIGMKKVKDKYVFQLLEQELGGKKMKVDTHTYKRVDTIDERNRCSDCNVLISKNPCDCKDWTHCDKLHSKDVSGHCESCFNRK